MQQQQQQQLPPSIVNGCYASEADIKEICLNKKCGLAKSAHPRSVDLDLFAKIAIVMPPSMKKGCQALRAVASTGSCPCGTPWHDHPNETQAQEATKNVMALLSPRGVFDFGPGPQSKTWGSSSTCGQNFGPGFGSTSGTGSSLFTDSFHSHHPRHEAFNGFGSGPTSGFRFAPNGSGWGFADSGSAEPGSNPHQDVMRVFGADAPKGPAEAGFEGRMFPGGSFTGSALDSFVAKSSGSTSSSK